MSNTKAKPAAKPAPEVQVRMRCVLSGDSWSVGAGEIATLTPDEAARLIDLGAAEALAD